MNKNKSNQTFLSIDEDYKKTIAESSYIGRKGYTISKSNLTEKDLQFLYKDLFLKPQIFGVNYGQEEANSFPVYRENNNKIYLPRFYGIQRYGLPLRNNLSEGTTINLHFAKTLRDYQEKIVDIYLKPVSYTHLTLPTIQPV